MTAQPLLGKKIAVILESQYIAAEIQEYQQLFTALGAEVHLMSRLWGQAFQTFVSEVETPATCPETLTVDIDFTKVDIKAYAAVIMAANYTSVRLRWVADTDTGAPITGDSGRQSPAVRFFYQAMMVPGLVKAFPCHGLWILSAIPEMLAGRKVTCNRVMLPDVRNAGGIYMNAPSGVVTDVDVITSDSASRTAVLVQAITEQILALEQGGVAPAVTAYTAPAVTLATSGVTVTPAKRRILMLVSEWGYWGEELVAPLLQFDKAGYETVFYTPTGKRPNAILVSKQSDYIDPPLGRSVTTPEMAALVTAIDNPDTEQGKRLAAPESLAALMPERPYWADPQLVRLMEIYHLQKTRVAEKLSAFDALIIVGGSGPIVDLVNNQRVHDLILAFYEAGKPIAAECYGVACLAFARNIESRQPIIKGKRVTGHCLEYDYKDGTGFMQARDTFLQFNMGPPPYPLEYILRDATGPDGAFIGNFGHSTSVIVDYPFITGRSTPDSALTGAKLIEVLDGQPKLRRWGW